MKQRGEWSDARCVLVLLVAAVTACATPAPIYRDRPVPVNVPVLQPCAGARPLPVTPLKDKTPDWDSLDVRQKAALVGKQGLDRQTYGEQLNAATAACPEAAK